MTGPQWATQDASVALTPGDRAKLVAVTTTPNPPGDTRNGGFEGGGRLVYSDVIRL